MTMKTIYRAVASSVSHVSPSFIRLSSLRKPEQSKVSFTTPYIRTMAMNCPICAFTNDVESVLTRHIEDTHFAPDTTPSAQAISRPTDLSPALPATKPTDKPQQPRRQKQQKQHILLDHDIYSKPAEHQRIDPYDFGRQPPPQTQHRGPRAAPNAPSQSRQQNRAQSNTPGESRLRGNIIPGAKVQVVLKEDQPSGKLTEGVVAQLLTNSANHPRGIKVRLVDGKVGRVQHIMGSG